MLRRLLSLLSYFTRKPRGVRESARRRRQLERGIIRVS